MKRAIIFFNGDKSDLSHAKKYIKSQDYIICADGGARLAMELGMKPHVIIGDFDSLSEMHKKKFEKQNIAFVKFQKEKDETDSELALQYAISKGFKNILVFGVLGSRLDHVMTNIFALSYLVEKGIQVTFIEGDQEIQVMNDTLLLKGNPGDLISLIPLRGDVKNITTTNLVFKLSHEKLFFGFSRGISNIMIKKTATVTISEGLLLIIHTRQLS